MNDDKECLFKFQCNGCSKIITEVLYNVYSLNEDNYVILKERLIFYSLDGGILIHVYNSSKSLLAWSLDNTL